MDATFSALLLLAAGTMTDVNGQTNFTQQFAINGQRGRLRLCFAMDGADASDPEMGGEHVHEFQRRCDSGITVKHGLDAGGHRARCGGGFTNIVTRSGKKKNGFSWIILRVLKELRSRCAGIISITHRLRSRAEFLHSVEMSSDLRMAGPVVFAASV